MNSLSRDEINQQGDSLISLEQVATMTQTSLTTIHSFIRLGVIEPSVSMLKLEDTWRVMKIMRLRRDLRLNLLGAAMVLDLTVESYRLRLRDP